VYRDLVAHTVTARDGSFDSGNLAAGASWSTVAARAGRLDYACSLHPTMNARLVVR
jgi:plastocyanin